MLLALLIGFIVFVWFIRHSIKQMNTDEYKALRKGDNSAGVKNKM